MSRSVTRVRYLLEEAADNITANRTTTVLAVATATVAMLGMGVFLLLYLNAQEALGSLKDEIKVIVYLKETVSAKEIGQLRSAVSGDPAVAAVDVVTREQALAAFRTQFPLEERLLHGLGDNPFPASLVVHVGSAYRSSEQVGGLVRTLTAFAEVDEVLYSQEWLDNLAVAVRYLRVLGLGIGVVLALSMVTILANTIKLTLYARREEIETLKLIGATTGFIKLPFVIEGAVLGGVGAACSLVLLRTLFGLAERTLALKGTFWGVGRGLAFLPDRVTVAFLLLGVLLGCLGSFVSLIQWRDARR